MSSGDGGRRFVRCCLCRRRSGRRDGRGMARGRGLGMYELLGWNKVDISIDCRGPIIYIS